MPVISSKDELLSEVEVAELRAMSGSEKMAIGFMWSAIGTDLLSRLTTRLHPDWTPARIRRHVGYINLHTCDDGCFPPAHINGPYWWRRAATP